MGLYTNAAGVSYRILEIIGLTGVTDTFVKQRIESEVAAPLDGDGSSAYNVTFQCFIQNNTGASITPTLTIKHCTATNAFSGSLTTDVNAVSLQSVASGATANVAYTYTPSSGTYFGVEVTLDFGSALNSNAKNISLAGFDIRPSPGDLPG